MILPCLTFRNLTLGYNGHAAIHHLSGAVACGSLTAVVGANGSGKSTLMKAIAGVLKPLSGSLEKASDMRLAYLPQQSEIDRSFPATVADIVALGLWPKRGWFRRHTREDSKALQEALVQVGLQGFEQRTLDSLSGGQMQRALFARVLLQDADIILLDEPFNAIDRRTIEDLIHLIKQWHVKGKTILAVLHDDECVRAHFPQTLLLARKAVAWGDTSAVMRPENLRKARHFQEAWDETAPWCAGEKHTHSHSEKSHQHV